MFVSYSFKNTFGLWQRFTDDNRNSFLYNPSFFDSNHFQRISQKLGVVQTDVCNHGDFGSNNIGTVQSPAHSHFNNSDIYFFLSEIIKSQPHGHFKKG